MNLNTVVPKSFSLTVRGTCIFKVCKRVVGYRPPGVSLNEANLRGFYN